MSKIFIGIDAQVDFIDGALPNKEAQNNVVLLNQAARFARQHNMDIMWTLDTHGDQAEYNKTLEGRWLPVHHCQKGQPGWNFHRSIEADGDDAVFEKPTFGSIEMLNSFILDNEIEPIEAIFMGGYCTDICGVSNALLLRAGLPDVPIYWLAFASAGSTPEKHQAALEVMNSCQIGIIDQYPEFEKVVTSI